MKGVDHGPAPRALPARTRKRYAAPSSSRALHTLTSMRTYDARDLARRQDMAKAIKCQGVPDAAAMLEALLAVPPRAEERPPAVLLRLRRRLFGGHPCRGQGSPFYVLEDKYNAATPINAVMLLA